MHTSSKAPPCPKCRAPTDPAHLRRELDWDTVMKSFLAAKSELLRLEGQARLTADVTATDRKRKAPASTSGRVDVNGAQKKQRTRRGGGQQK